MTIRRLSPSAAAVADVPAVVTDLTGATHRPFVLSRGAVERIRGRLALASPHGISPKSLIDRNKRIQNLPLDVLVVLESLQLMADAGNVIAGDLLASERARLDIR